jgi:hypothetical protein
MTSARTCVPFLALSIAACATASEDLAVTATFDASAIGVVDDAGTTADAAPLPSIDSGSPPFVVDAGMPVAIEQPSYEEVFEQGLTRYVGSPQVQEKRLTTSGNINVHHFSADNRGPVCMKGSEFFVETKKGSSDTLMIFLQGGGVCLTEVCAATPDPILTLQLFSVSGLIGVGGLLDASTAKNPTRDFNVVNAPYCDGSLFSGDVDRMLADQDNGQSDMVFQRGLQNLTATLETAYRTFPNPPRIVLVGSSGGAYGVVAGTVMARYFYPNTPLLVISDSGAPIVNGIDTGFITRALTEFQALEMVPHTCPECLANGHATEVLSWALRFDTNLTVAYMTHARDHVIGEFFMHTTADQFQAAVVGESERIIREFPGRAFRFVIPSARHTLAMGMDGVSPGLQGTFLGLAGSAGVGFVGPQVTSKELSTWSLGGMNETGRDDEGKTWIAYDWLRSLLTDPLHTPNVLQLQ